ncbi:MAG: hypothetical protein H6596_03515 [Flavobacteriales bacterium]|nr:hypothetical protein [Flavobacteriales bacterium]
MRRSIIALSLVCSFTLHAQQDWNLDPLNIARGHIALGLGNGSTAYAIDRNFGFDSSYVEVMWCDPMQNVMQAASIRTHQPLNFLNDARLAGEGMMVAGTSYGFLDYPSVMKLDSLGNVEWYDGLLGLMTIDNHYQDQIGVLLVEGNGFSAYTYPGGTWRDGIYRFNGSVANGFHQTGGHEVATPTDVRFRIGCGTLTPVAGTHVLGGSGYMNDDAQTKEVLLWKMNSAGTSWMRYYDMGSDAPVNQLEEASSIRLLTDSTYLVVGSLANANNQFDAFAMKVTTAGSVVWCRRYTRTGGGIQFGDVFELPNGDLLIGGTDDLFRGRLLLLAADGTIQWSRRYLSSGQPAAHLLHGIRAAYPEGYWVHSARHQLYLDPALNGCDFTDEPDISGNAFTPTVTDLFYTDLPQAPDTLGLSWQERTPEISWQANCTFNAVEEGAATSPLLAYPDPTDGLLYLSGDDVRTGMPVVVRDLMGREVLRTRYHGVLDLSGLSPGGYLVELPELQRRVRVVKH